MDNYVKQLNDIISNITKLQSESQYSDLSDISKNEIREQITLVHSAISRIAGINSIYYKEFSEIRNRNGYECHKLLPMKGILQAFIKDIENGYLDDYEKIIQGDIFTDYLEMAKYLVDENYKDAAAVIVGSTLEEYLRQLCSKNDIEIEITKGEKVTRKKADLLNSELASNDVYSKLDQKNVTAWLDLRNKAAHGNYKEYSKEQVDLMISGISDFLTRNYFK